MGEHSEHGAGVGVEGLAEGLFFVVGTGRCGTTLLQAMLSSHPRLFIPPETKFFICLDPAGREGDPLPDAAAFEAWLARARGWWFWSDLELDEGRLRDDVLGGDRSARSLFLAMMAQWHERGGKPRMGEKTPHHMKETARILGMFPGARFVHIVRDPRDVAASMLKLNWGEHGSVRRYARGWRRMMERDARLAHELGSAWLRLRFEDLVREPERELRRVCEHLGEAFDPVMLRYDQRESAGFSAREAAWKGDTFKPLDQKRVGAAQRSLTMHQVRTIERTVGPWLERLGYARAEGERDRAAWVIGDACEAALDRLGRVGQSVRKRVG